MYIFHPPKKSTNQPTNQPINPTQHREGNRLGWCTGFIIHDQNQLTNLSQSWESKVVVKWKSNSQATCHCDTPSVTLDWHLSIYAAWNCVKSSLVKKIGLLVGGWTTHLKNMLVKMGSSSKNRDENKKCLKPRPSLPLKDIKVEDSFFLFSRLQSNFKMKGQH